MRFTTLAALLLGVSFTLALPAAEKHETCCCCDPSYGPNACPAIVCQERKQCICPAVACPTWAPTVWADYGALPTSVPTKGDGKKDGRKSCGPFKCCCCNPGRGAVVCNWRPGPGDCICPAVVCPTGAPTIWDPLPTPTPTPMA